MGKINGVSLPPRAPATDNAAPAASPYVRVPLAATLRRAGGGDAGIGHPADAVRSYGPSLMQELRERAWHKINQNPLSRYEFKHACRLIEEPTMQRNFSQEQLGMLGDAVRCNYVAHLIERHRQGATLPEYREALSIYERVAAKQVELFEEIKRAIGAMEKREQMTKTYNDLYDAVDQNPHDSIDLEVAREGLARLKHVAAELGQDHVKETAQLHDCVHHNWAVAFLADRRFSNEYRFSKTHGIYPSLVERDEDLLKEIQAGYQRYCVEKHDAGGKTASRRKGRRPVRNGIGR